MSTKTIKKSPINELLESSFNIIQYANAFNEYIGWSMYSGYATKESTNQKDSNNYMYYSSKGLCYIGEWTGINKNSSAAEIKKDIDARIRVLMAAYKEALKSYGNQNPILEKDYPNGRDALEALSNKYFIVPEFYFRCKEGPYPSVKIQRIDKVVTREPDYEGDIPEKMYAPVEYIKKEIEEQFKELVEQHFATYNTFHTYHLVIGSIMTSNIKNYEQFFDEEVKQRAAEFSEAYKKKDLAASTKTYFDNPNLRRFNPKTIRDDYKNFFDEILADARKEPMCTVRNRGLVFFGNPVTGSYSEYKYEKQKQSSIDLPLGTFEGEQLVHGNMITEWMATHPSYSITGGDKLGHPDQSFARFSPFGNSIDFDGLIKNLFLQKYKLTRPIYELIKQVFIARNRNFDTGIELCLDHLEKRLRRTVGMTTEAGADDDNYPLTVQIVPSAGASLDPDGLAIEQGGAAFNVDGLVSLLDEEDKIRFLETLSDDENEYDVDSWKTYSSDFFIENGVSYRKIYNEVYCRYMNSEWQADDGKYYYSHTQLAFALSESYMAGYVNALGNNNERSRTYLSKRGQPYNYLLDHFDSKNIPLKNIDYNKDLFVAGIGELHHYYPNQGNYPIKNTIGKFNTFKHTAIKTTPSEHEGGIVELRVFFQNNMNNVSLKDIDFDQLDTDGLEHLKWKEQEKPVHKIYHGDGYSTIKNDRGGYDFTGLMVKYRSGYIQYIGCDAEPENKDYLKHIAEPEHYPEYISIKLDSNKYIDAIYTSYETEINEKAFNLPIKNIEFRIVDKEARKKKWTNIFQNIKKTENIMQEFSVSRIIEGNRRPLERIVGYETFVPYYSDTLSSGELMRLDFYFGKKRFHSLPVVRSLVDTATPPSFIPTPKKPITRIRLYSSFDSYSGIQVNYGGLEAPVFGLADDAQELALSKYERLVGIASTVVFEEHFPGKCKFIEFRFKILDKEEKAIRWSKIFSPTGQNQELIYAQEKMEEQAEIARESVKTYRAKVFKRLKELGYSKEQYSFRYAYFKGLPIWKIIPHIRQADGMSERYNIEILDGLTVKIGNPF